jgi:hypothetical protein
VSQVNKMPPPAHPDTPWWSNLVAVLLTAIVTAGATIYFMKGGVGAPGLPSSGGFGSLLKDTLVYMPHALLLYGVIADMLTYEGVYSIGSLVGIVSLFVHVLFKFVWKGTFDVISTIIKAVQGEDGRADKPGRIGKVADTIPAANLLTSTPAKGTTPKFGGAEAGSFFKSYTGCDIQGFDWAHSPYAPQSLVIIASIFSYYGIDLINNRGGGNAGATIGLGLLAFIAQLFLAGNCSLPGEPEISKLYQAILAGAEGLFVGGVSYSVVQAYFPSRLPSSTISPFPRKSPSDLRDGKYDENGNPWVCVKNVCTPDLSKAEDRAKFGKMIAESTGNGSVAQSEDCAAT